MSKPCAQCPWRFSNQGKRHFGGFYTKRNLQSMWNALRRGGGKQSCHLTDPRHPDHITAGAAPNATPQECPGSVILIVRELKRIMSSVYIGEDGAVNTEALVAYLRDKSRRRLSRDGILYWGVQRAGPLAGVPFVGGRPLPIVDDEDLEIGLPEWIK
jgi:hypothetical protein